MPELFTYEDIRRHRDEAYVLGIAEGRRIERAAWMKTISDSVIDALAEAVDDLPKGT